MALLKAQKRREAGTRKARALRKQGLIPGVIYGHGRKTQPITMSEHDVTLAVLHGERLLEIELDGKKENALIKEVQYDTFGQEVIHVDLARVRLDERVEVTVPVVLRGTSAGISENGVLHQAANEVTLDCLVSQIPEEISLQVTELNVGEARYMRDLPLPEGAKLVSNSDTMVCSIIVLAEEEEAPPEAEEVEGAAAEPEIIGEKPEEGEEEAEKQPTAATDQSPRRAEK